MLRSRLLIVLGVSFLAASATRADNLGYINCSGHPDETPVFAKARQTRETVASLPCGERFTVILYGFIFSRIQTADGKIGYVYSNLITVGPPQAPIQQSSPAPTPARAAPAASVSVRGATISDGSPSSIPVTQPQPAPAQPSPTQAPPAASPAPASPSPRSNFAVTAVVQPSPTTAAQPQPTPAQPAPTQSSSPAPTTHVPATGVRGTTVTGVLPAPIILTGPQPSSPEPAPAERAAPESPAPISSASTSAAATSNAPEATAPAEQPAPTTSEPQPEAAQPAAPAIRPAKTLDSWEKPNPGGRRTPLIELFGGYAFARMDGGAGTFNNMHGALGSFGWNANSWLQVVADTSYNVLTVTGTKTVLYGNHYGPRIFYRRRNRWGLTPFVEGLVGGSRADTTTGGIKTSVNTISFKAGGGLDIKPTRHLVIRLLNVDYYRTSFGTNVNQNNYWASAGIVLRLFGGGSE
jgi:hypothetical protein